MTRVIRAIRDELRRPSDQGRDWYGWLTAQAGHSLLGLLITAAAVMFGAPGLAAWAAVSAVYGLVKEVPDYAMSPSWRTLRDCLRDWLFVLGGAGVAVTLHAGSGWFWAALASVAAGLVVGTYQRAARAITAG
jgi:hypothetical protein